MKKSYNKPELYTENLSIVPFLTACNISRDDALDKYGPGGGFINELADDFDEDDPDTWTWVFLDTDFYGCDTSIDAYNADNQGMDIEVCLMNAIDNIVIANSF